MYKFVDIYENASAGDLPAEAMSYNGVYLESQINGYRTLHVSGRELMESEIQEEIINLIDGSNYLGKRYPARTITVTYQLIAESPEAFREAFNTMNKLLSKEQVEIIFNDETDKYFIGTKVDNSQPTPGSNSITGTIEIYCSTPFKFSTVLKEFTAVTNGEGILQTTIHNDGSVPVSIDYEITHHAESGFIGIVSEKGTMQYGKRDEADKEPYKRNETLVHLQNFIDANDDVNGKDYMHPSYGMKGSLTTSNWFGSQFLAFGSKGVTVGRANGGLRTITIPADSESNKGAKNWYAYFHLIFYAGLMGQTGEMCINFLTSDNKLIAGVNWHKTDTTGNTGHYDLVTYDPSPSGDMAGRVLKTYTYTTSHLHSENPWYWDWGNCDLRKEGSKLTFFYWGGYPSFVIPEIENMVCTKIQISIKQWGDRGGVNLLSNMGFDAFDFTKLNVDKWKDTPNRFRSGDVCKVVGDSSKFYVNEMHRPGDEILGTQYFKSDPGDTDIQFVVSEWTEKVPTIKIRIREAWL